MSRSNRRPGGKPRPRPKPGDPGYDRYMQKLARKQNAKRKPKRKPRPGTRGYKAWANKDYTKASTSGPKTSSPTPEVKSNNSSLTIKPQRTSPTTGRRNTNSSATGTKRYKRDSIQSIKNERGPTTQGVRKQRRSGQRPQLRRK